MLIFLYLKRCLLHLIISLTDRALSHVFKGIHDVYRILTDICFPFSQTLCITF